VAVVCSSLDEVRDVAERAPEIARSVRAVLAPYIPSALVALLSAAGIAALRLDAAHAKSLKGQRSIALPAPSQWAEHGATPVQVGAAKLPMTWLAQAHERAWATGDAAWRSASPANLVDRRGPSLAGDAGRRGASPVRA
jgi:aconitate hydratase